MIDIFNNLSVVGKSLVVILIFLFIILIGLIIYLCVKNKNENDDITNTDFFDDIKSQNENEKSVFIDNVDIQKANEIATKIEMPKEEPTIKDVKTNEIKTNEEKISNNNKFDISETAKKMEEDIENSAINLTEYEVEQEEKAIISYTELLNKVQKSASDAKVNIQTVELESKVNENNDDFNYNTEVLDFSDLNEMPIDKENTTTLFKQDDIKEMLNIKDIDTTLYSSDEFLKALKELRDNLD